MPILTKYRFSNNFFIPQALSIVHEDLKIDYLVKLPASILL